MLSLIVMVIMAMNVLESEKIKQNYETVDIECEEYCDISMDGKMKMRLVRDKKQEEEANKLSTKVPLVTKIFSLKVMAGSEHMNAFRVHSRPRGVFTTSSYKWKCTTEVSENWTSVYNDNLNWQEPIECDGDESLKTNNSKDLKTTEERNILSQFKWLSLNCNPTSNNFSQYCMATQKDLFTFTVSDLSYTNVVLPMAVVASVVCCMVYFVTRRMLRSPQESFSVARSQVTSEYRSGQKQEVDNSLYTLDHNQVLEDDKDNDKDDKK